MENIFKIFKVYKLVRRTNLIGIPVDIPTNTINIIICLLPSKLC